jgi:hypothetical protein
LPDWPNCKDYIYGLRNFNTLDLGYDPLPQWGIFTWLKVKKEALNKNNTKIARA